ncbi:AAA family ATPase [Tenuifilum thalassicum]|uniref:AAA family ATPase n=1 Tax=Tenuifilum thalassicum TaxID=2590900 RepID=A0A7D4BEL0_9BACT|nr:AAA family ATPase [Tenuifilum thalassicum]QKG80803.1 AAA family ATPase [Tenuifilum thalassicum]
MEKIIIKNFGPIDNVELSIKPFMVFIGPQASGKSTISKSIYFFKSLRNDILKYFIEIIDTGNYDKPLGNIGKRIRTKFLNFFGPTAHTDDFYLHYEFGNNKALSINLRGRYVNQIFNLEFKRI